MVFFFFFSRRRRGALLLTSPGSPKRSSVNRPEWFAGLQRSDLRKPKWLGGYFEHQHHVNILSLPINRKPKTAIFGSGQVEIHRRFPPLLYSIQEAALGSEEPSSEHSPSRRGTPHSRRLPYTVHVLPTVRLRLRSRAGHPLATFRAGSLSTARSTGLPLPSAGGSQEVPVQVATSARKNVGYPKSARPRPVTCTGPGLTAMSATDASPQPEQPPAMASAEWADEAVAQPSLVADVAQPTGASPSEAGPAAGAPPDPPQAHPCMWPQEQLQPAPMAGTPLPPGYPAQLAPRAIGLYAEIRTMSCQLRVSPFPAYVFLQSLAMQCRTNLLDETFTMLLRFLWAYEASHLRDFQTAQAER